jgi:hypothetical protein
MTSRIGDRWKSSQLQRLRALDSANDVPGELNLKLSEAILLGSTVVRGRAGRLRFSHTGEECALGMAAIAVGCTFGRPLRQIPVENLRTANIESVFGSWLLRVVMRPCECPPELTRGMRIKDVIAHLFDVHVIERKNWTLADLVGWVQRWEPPEAPSDATGVHIVFGNAPSPSRAAELRAEEAEWQSTRKAFEARHQSKRRRGPSPRSFVANPGGNVERTLAYPHKECSSRDTEL